MQSTSPIRDNNFFSLWRVFKVAFVGFREFDTANLRFFDGNQAKNIILPFKICGFLDKILVIILSISHISRPYPSAKSKSQKMTRREARPALKRESYYHPLPE
jgi:hypothetical protein